MSKWQWASIGLFLGRGGGKKCFRNVWNEEVFDVQCCFVGLW